MKKIIWLMVLVLSFGLVIGAVNTQYIGFAPDLKVSITMQDPDPVEPGKEVEVSFKIENNGTLAHDVNFEVVPEYPFTLVPGESASKSIGTIGTSQDGKQSVIVRYRMKVALDANEGNHKIKARYQNEGFDTWVTLENLKIKVQSREAIISIDKFLVEPSVVEPGSKTKLSIVLKSYASSLLKDVRVALDFGSGETAVPFSTLGSTNEKVMSYMQPSSTEAFDFELLVDPDAISKTYKIPVNLRYSDSISRNFSKQNFVTLVVGGEPDVSVGIESTTIYTANSAGEVTVKIVNKGLPDMKFVNVKLASSSSYRLLSPSEVYIGNIDSDDYETADFKLFVERGIEKKATLPLTIEYKDANNKDYKSAVNLELPIYTSSEAKKLGLKKNGNSTIWIVIVVLAVAGFFGYRYWRRRKK